MAGKMGFFLVLFQFFAALATSFFDTIGDLFFLHSLPSNLNFSMKM
jgi:hypothetical protein